MGVFRQDPREVQRLEVVLENARIVKNAVHDRIGAETDAFNKDRTQYFEKLSLGCGATIAAIVSFVGSHQASLHPRWLLRSSLVTFVLALIAAQLRNLQYPRYVQSARWAEYMGAAEEHDTAKYHYLRILPVALDIDTGKPIDMAEYERSYNAGQQQREPSIRKQKLRSERHYTLLRVADISALGLTLIGLCLLVALAWANF